MVIGVMGTPTVATWVLGLALMVGATGPTVILTFAVSVPEKFVAVIM